MCFSIFRYTLHMFGCALAYLPIYFIWSCLHHNITVSLIPQTLLSYKVHPRGLAFLKVIFSSGGAARFELNEPCTHRPRTDRFVSAAFEVVMTTCLLSQSKAGLALQSVLAGNNNVEGMRTVGHTAIVHKKEKNPDTHHNIYCKKTFNKGYYLDVIF